MTDFTMALGYLRTERLQRYRIEAAKPFALSPPMSQRILFISNGHGEDNHSSHIIRTLQDLRPSLEIAAMPIVGQGHAYRRLGLPIIGPTQILPSGGFTYMDRWRLLDDLRSGLLGLTWRQLQAVRRYAPSCDLVAATGDFVGQTFAYLSDRPFVSFISPLSAMYEGQLKLGLILQNILRSPRCRAIATRDSATAIDLQRQGFTKAQFGGIPSLDRLKPTGKDLQLRPEQPMVALLPGSRLPEAVRNFKLQLRLVIETARLNPAIQYRAALVPALYALLPEIAQAEGWRYEHSWLSYNSQGTPVDILCLDDAFSDIVCRTSLVIGMAGLAVDQAVAIGKPVIQIPGEGPQFTYAFAEAQTRLLGLSAQTVGTRSADAEILSAAARCLVKTLADKDYLSACVENGQRRFGPLGASSRIAQLILAQLELVTADCGDMTAV